MMRPTIEIICAVKDNESVTEEEWRQYIVAWREQWRDAKTQRKLSACKRRPGEHGMSYGWRAMIEGCRRELQGMAVERLAAACTPDEVGAFLEEQQ